MNYLSCDAVHICKKITILYHSYLLISLISELEIKKDRVQSNVIKLSTEDY